MKNRPSFFLLGTKYKIKKKKKLTWAMKLSLHMKKIRKMSKLMFRHPKCYLTPRERQK